MEPKSEYRLEDLIDDDERDEDRDRPAKSCGVSRPVERVPEAGTKIRTEYRHAPLDCHRCSNMGMRLIVGDVEILKAELIDLPHISPNDEPRQRQGHTLQLLV